MKRFTTLLASAAVLCTLLQGITVLAQVPPRPPVATQCSDGIDNDGDRLIDYPGDPDCASFQDKTEATPPPAPQCSDGIDNDGDGRIDYMRMCPGCSPGTPSHLCQCRDVGDPGCSSRSDNDEYNPNQCRWIRQGKRWVRSC